jgi:nicotinate-nucleotide adenylyltransferase
MRIGVFGGTFDPVHLGHLITAEQCREQVALDEVWFVPAFQPPHKQGQSVTPFDRRVEMLQLALMGQPAFRVSEIEKERGGLSFTVDTIEELHVRRPGDELFLVVGSDCLPDLSGWRDPIGIIKRAGLVVVARPHWPMWPAGRLRDELKLPADAELRMIEVRIPLVDLASRELRQKSAEGRSIRFLVTRAVEAYIADKKLYRHPQPNISSTDHGGV